jgi:hypothetical protein
MANGITRTLSLSLQGKGVRHSVWQASMHLLIKRRRSHHENARGQSMIRLPSRAWPCVNILPRTAENTLSPTSNFIDLSGSFGGSPPLPYGRPLPTTKDIYDMPDEQVRVSCDQLARYKLTICRNRWIGNHLRATPPLSIRSRVNPNKCGIPTHPREEQNTAFGLEQAHDSTTPFLMPNLSS